MSGDALVLVLNSGSSSVKYQLIRLSDGDGDGHTGGDAGAGKGKGGQRKLASGAVERIGESGGGKISHKNAEGKKYEAEQAFADHDAAMAAVLKAFSDAGPALDGLTAVGHRVVHGGERFADPVLIDDAVVTAIRELSPLAPLHNPANLALIEVARKTFADVPQVAVFDTAFHQTLPPAAYTYAVPRSWREDLNVRRYGFHGTSHRYVSRRAAAMLGKSPDETNVIVLHLGNGCSAAAVSGGRSVDTSMGLTPLEGLVMGTRSGDVDPALPAYLSRVAGLSGEEIDKALNKESGLLALAGSNDMRDVKAAAAKDDAAAQLALDVYCHRIRKYVGAYYAVLGRVDAVVFTAGVGEHDDQVRALSLAGLERLGIVVDAARNEEDGGGERFISPPDAEVAVLVVPTDEEIEIATQTLSVVAS